MLRLPEPYKAVLFDLDGTLLDNQKSISPSTQNIISKLAESGYITGVCTARGLAMIENSIIPHFAPNSIHITSNGGLITNQNGDVIFESLIPDKEVKKIFSDFPDSFQLTHFQNSIGANQKAYKKLIKNKLIFPGVKTIILDSVDDWSSPGILIGDLTRKKLDKYSKESNLQ